MLAGCAAQGPPRPPRVQVPERVTDLAVHQVGRLLELSFTPPTLATDGEGLTKPMEVEIFREIRAPGTAQPQAPRANSNSTISVPTPGAPWVALETSDLNRLARGQKVVYVDRLSEPQFASSLDSSFSYTVRALTRGFRRRAILSETSNRAAATLLDVSGPVRGLKVISTEKAVSLSWEAPAHTLSGAPVAELDGYRVYRSEKPKLEPFNIVGEPKEPAFLDPHFAFGRTYRYKVRAVFKQGTQEAESEDAQAYEVTPHDIFPPQTPQGLTALYVGVVELIWNANREPDLAGYNVYRREEGKPSQRINKDLVRTPIYRDAAIELQRHYFYQVTAVDLSGNESKPSTEAQAETQ
jgi:hypothetical protein